MGTKDQPLYTDCKNCGRADHRDYPCPCQCHTKRRIRKIKTLSWVKVTK